MCKHAESIPSEEETRPPRSNLAEVSAKADASDTACAWPPRRTWLWCAALRMESTRRGGSAPPTCHGRCGWSSHHARRTPTGLDCEDARESRARPGSHVSGCGSPSGYLRRVRILRLVAFSALIVTISKVRKRRKR